MASGRDSVVLRRIDQDELEYACYSEMTPINLVDLTNAESLLLEKFLTLAFSHKPCFLEKGAWRLDIESADPRVNHEPLRIILPRSILLRPRETDPNAWRGEVIGSRIAPGNYSEVYKVLTTLYLDDKNVLQGKNNPRIVKVQYNIDEHSKREVQNESSLNLQAGYLCSKEVIFDGNTSYIVARRFIGGDVIDYLEANNDNFLRRKDLTDELLNIIVNMMHATKDQLHNRGIISRDIKPENMIVEDGTHKVYNVDLGLGKRQYESDNRVVGTPGYVPVEVLMERGTSFASDTFALGVTSSHVLGAEIFDFQSSLESLPSVMKVRFNGLFSICHHLSLSHQDLLRDVLEDMTCLEPHNRGHLDLHITAVEKVILDRWIVQLAPSEREYAQHAYHVAASLRRKIDPINYLNMNAPDANYQLQHATDNLISRLKSGLSTALERISDSPLAIKVFVKTLRADVLLECTTKDEVKIRLAKLMQAYEITSCELTECLADAVRLNEKLKGKIWDEIQSIQNATLLRRRKIIPCIDGVMEITQKLKKSIQSYEAILHRYAVESVRLTQCGFFSHRVSAASERYSAMSRTAMSNQSRITHHHARCAALPPREPSTESNDLSDNLRGLVSHAALSETVNEATSSSISSSATTSEATSLSSSPSYSTADNRLGIPAINLSLERGVSCAASGISASLMAVTRLNFGFMFRSPSRPASPALALSDRSADTCEETLRSMGFGGDYE